MLVPAKPAPVTVALKSGLLPNHWSLYLPVWFCMSLQNESRPRKYEPLLSAVLTAFWLYATAFGDERSEPKTSEVPDASSRRKTCWIAVHEPVVQFAGVWKILPQLLARTLRTELAQLRPASGSPVWPKLVSMMPR